MGSHAGQSVQFARGNWRQSYALVAAAGPLANLIMAALFGIGCVR